MHFFHVVETFTKFPDLYNSLPHETQNNFLSYNDQYMLLSEKMQELDVTSVEYCMLQMQEYTLFEEFKTAVKNIKTANDPNKCKQCGTALTLDTVNSATVCESCGLQTQLVCVNQMQFTDRERYNRNPVHHYHFYEHFSQTLCDFTGIGNRNVPEHIMRYCRRAMLPEKNVTSEAVFNALRIQGYRPYYNLKYIIAARIRGSWEFKMSTHEIELMRVLFKRYSFYFMDYQARAGVGTISSRGKRRVFWPMRFILKQLCDMIGRADLKQFLRSIVTTRRKSVYKYHWKKLVEYVDQRSSPVDFKNEMHNAKALLRC